MMHVFIDSFVLRFPRTGIVNYVFNLISELNRKPDLHLHLLLEDRNFTDAAIRQYVEAYAQVGIVERLEDTAADAKRRDEKLAARLPKPREVSRAIDPDAIYHATDWYHYPGRFARANILTYFDLTTTLFPQFHENTNIVKEQRKLQAAKDFDHIIAISGATRTDLIKHGGISPEKVSVSYLGVDEVYDRNVYIARDEFLKSMNMDPARPYILSVSTIEPRKNTIGILNSYRRLCETNRRYAEIALVLSGRDGWGTDSLQEYLEQYPFRENVIFAGYVPLTSMPSLYRHAEAFLYLSFYEGFGIPILEAMKSKCPVICSNTSSMPEVIGDTGELVSPHNSDEAVAALIRVLDDPIHADSLRYAGFQRSRKFSWQKHADDVLRIYNQY